MADDLGWRDVGVYGSELYDTPNIDRLAKRGMIFSDAYAASSLCSPTRAATLTGQTVSSVKFTSPTGHIDQKSKRVTLRYDLSTRSEAGDALVFTINTNSVVGVSAAAAAAPLFGPPVKVIPNAKPQEIRIPLPHRVEAGELIVVFDLEQPGRAQITNPRMMDGDVIGRT